MGIRVVRHMAGRAVDADESKLLAVIPYGAGEVVRHIRFDAYAATQDDNSIDQPPEINWVAVDVPWSILLTHSTKGGSGGTGSLDTVAEWDTIFRNLMLEYGTDGNNFYGGDFDAVNPDVIGTVEEQNQDPAMSGDAGDEPAIERSKGPMGIVRLLSREVLMRPALAEGANAVRWFDEFNVTANGRGVREAGGCVLVGVIRYNVSSEENFAVEFTPDTARGLSALIGGDVQRVQEILAHNSGAVGDRLRTTMFGGDVYIESATVRPLDAKACMKIWASVETPYQLGAV